MARATPSTSSATVIISTQASGCSASSRRVASMPPMPGIRTSISTRDGPLDRPAGEHLLAAGGGEHAGHAGDRRHGPAQRLPRERRVVADEHGRHAQCPPGPVLPSHPRGRSAARPGLAPCPDASSARTAPDLSASPNGCHRRSQDRGDDLLDRLGERLDAGHVRRDVAPPARAADQHPRRRTHPGQLRQHVGGLRPAWRRRACTTAGPLRRTAASSAASGTRMPSWRTSTPRSASAAATACSGRLCCSSSGRPAAPGRCCGAGPGSPWWRCSTLVRHSLNRCSTSTPSPVEAYRSPRPISTGRDQRLPGRDDALGADLAAQHLGDAVRVQGHGRPGQAARGGRGLAQRDDPAAAGAGRPVRRRRPAR